MTADPSRISITICGDGGCGKSSITLRLVRSQWTSEYDPTIEDSYSITRRIDGRTYHLSLTDTAGQEEYRGMWGGSNLRSDAFLMVYDITQRSSLDALEYFNDLVDMESDTRLEAAARAYNASKGKNGVRPPQDYGITQPVKFVAGNKCDLQESRQVDAKTGLEWARGRNCGFMETSARNVVNIEETFALIVRRVVDARRRAETMFNGPLLNEGNGRATLPPNGMTFDMNTSSNSGVGTRRAMTAPLSPLPVDEKTFESRTGRRRAFWSRFKCW